MLKLEQLSKAAKSLKALERDLVKYQKLRDKDMSSASPKQIAKHNADLNWLAMHIDKATHHAHVAVVEAGLGNPFEDDYYGETTYNPSGWHEYNFTREKPKAA